MEIAGIMLLGIILALLLLQQFKAKDSGLNQQILDLKNQLQELRTGQLQGQNQALIQQTDLLRQTQKGMSEQLNEIMRTVNENLNKSQGNITSQLSQTGTVVGEIQKKLGALEETTKQMKDIGKDIASLQDILQAPKLRGNLGEYLLEELLRQILPAKNYAMKYSFKNGAQVDAVIRLGDRLIPIDAKFPLESFQRLIGSQDEESRKAYKKEFVKSVKARIDEIADKYIRSDEETFDFALIYIPAENVFYETIISDSLTAKEYEIFNYAIEKHVIPVSPNSLYAYLMAIAHGLKGLKIEQQTKDILSGLARVQDAFSRFYNDFTMLGKHLSNADSKFQDMVRKAEKFHNQLSLITGIHEELPGAGNKVLDNPE